MWETAALSNGGVPSSGEYGCTEMVEDESEAFLQRETSGTLSLTDGRDTYAVPESFGYDGEYLYFQPVYGGDSQKMAFIETTDTATFTVWTENPARSVIVRGAIEEVPEEQDVIATNAIAENAELPTLNVIPDQPLEELSMDHYRLRPGEVSGRKFGVATDG